MATIHNEQGLTIVEVDPEYDSLDEWRIRDFRGLMLDAADHAERPLMLIDLAATTFIGSSFIGVLVRTWKRLRDRQGRMALCNVSPDCANVLHVTRLDTVWDCFSSREEGIRGLLDEAD